MATQETVGETLESYFDNPKFSDFIVRCKGKSWRTHKVMLCTQSKFFNNSCNGQFKESHENVLDLSENEPEIVEAALRYIYDGSYAVPESPKIFAIGFHAAVAGFADRYNIPKLVVAAAESFQLALFDGLHAYLLHTLLLRTAAIYDQLPESNRLLRAPLLLQLARDYDMCHRMDKVAEDTPLSLRKSTIDCFASATESHAGYARDFVTLLMHGFPEFDSRINMDEAVRAGKPKKPTHSFICSKCQREHILCDSWHVTEFEGYKTAKQLCWACHRGAITVNLKGGCAAASQGPRIGAEDRALFLLD